MTFKTKSPQSLWLSHYYYFIQFIPVVMFKHWNTEGWIHYNEAKECYKYQLTFGWLFWYLTVFWRKVGKHEAD